MWPQPNYNLLWTGSWKEQFSRRNLHIVGDPIPTFPRLFFHSTLTSPFLSLFSKLSTTEKAIGGWKHDWYFTISVIETHVQSGETQTLRTFLWFVLQFSLKTILWVELATADVNGAYMQSNVIKKDLYVQPPKRLSTYQFALRNLLRLSYGIVEARRQWLGAFEKWLIDEYGASWVKCVEQLLLEKRRSDEVDLLMTKVVDNILILKILQNVLAKSLRSVESIIVTVLHL